MNNYKGLYHNQRTEQKYYEAGAHFKYSELYYILESVQKSQSRQEKDNFLPFTCAKIQHNPNTVQSRNILSLLKSNTQKYYNINPPKKKEFNRSIIINDSFIQQNKSSLNIHPRTNSEEANQKQASFQSLFAFNHNDKSSNKKAIKPYTHLGYDPLYLSNANANKYMKKNEGSSDNSKNKLSYQGNNNGGSCYMKIQYKPRQLINRQQNELSSLLRLNNYSLKNLHEQSAFTSLDNINHSFLKKRNNFFNSSAKNVIRKNHNSISPITLKLNNSYLNQKSIEHPIENNHSRNRNNSLFKLNKENLQTTIQEERKRNTYISLQKRNIEVKKHNDLSINILSKPKPEMHKVTCFGSGFGLELINQRSIQNQKYKMHNKYTKISMLSQGTDYSLFNKTNENITLNNNHNTSYIGQEKKKENNQKSIYHIQEQTLSNVSRTKLFYGPIAKNNNTCNNNKLSIKNSTQKYSNVYYV